MRDIDPGRVVLLSGCTASGKSALALDLARRQGRAVVNADALQVYDGWRILTARPGDEDLARAPHLLYGHVDHRAAYSAGDWLREVAPLLDARPAPVIVGGTGLYFQALTRGLAEIPPTDPQVRAAANARMAEAGNPAMAAELDAATRARIDLRNPARVQRAWEVLRQTGRGLAAWQDETGPALLPEAQAACVLVQAGRDALNARIDRRFDAMLEGGAWEEARAMAPGWDPALQSSRAIGAGELIAALAGEMTPDEAISAAKTATHRYAKRQRTWMRSKMGGWRQVVSGI
nr:tRNA (adenosine(37)-N6)-dimethylallyltransferase MiaA [Mangrovicoccus algicola]